MLCKVFLSVSHLASGSPSDGRNCCRAFCRAFPMNGGVQHVLGNCVEEGAANTSIGISMDAEHILNPRL